MPTGKNWTKVTNFTPKDRPIFVRRAKTDGKGYDYACVTWTTVRTTRVEYGFWKIYYTDQTFSSPEEYMEPPE